jgi:hypothetical protein
MPDFAFFLIFSIPLIAIAGGITMAILRMASQHRLMELAQRERIALIEKGADPAKLPPPAEVNMGWSAGDLVNRPFAEISRRRAQNMTIGGIILLFLGIGIGIFIYFVAGDEGRPALIGLIPASLGLALLVSARIVARDAGNGRSGPGPEAPRS